MSSSISPSDYAAWREFIGSLDGQMPADELARLRAGVDEAESSGRPIDPETLEQFNQASLKLQEIAPPDTGVRAERFGETAPGASGISAGRTVYSLTHPTIEGHLSIRFAQKKGSPDFIADIWLLNFSGVFVAIHKKEGLGSKECDWAIVFPDQAEGVKKLTAGERRVNDKNDYHEILDAIGRASIGNEVNKDHPLYYPVRDYFTLTLARRPGVPLNEFIGETALHLLDDFPLFGEVGASKLTDGEFAVTPLSKLPLPFGALDAGSDFFPDPLPEKRPGKSDPVMLANPSLLLTLKFKGEEEGIAEYRFFDLEGILCVMTLKPSATEAPSIVLVKRDATGPFRDRFLGWRALEEEGVISRKGYREILDDAVRTHGFSANSERVKIIPGGDSFSLLFPHGRADALIAGWDGDSIDRRAGPVVARTERDVRVLAKAIVPMASREMPPTARPDLACLYLVDIGGAPFLFMRRGGQDRDAVPNDRTRLFVIRPEAREAVAETIRKAEQTVEGGARIQALLERCLREKRATVVDFDATEWPQKIPFADGGFSLVMPLSAEGETFDRYLSRWFIVFDGSGRPGASEALKRYGLKDKPAVFFQTHPLIRLNAAPHGRLYQAGSLVASYDSAQRVLLFYHRRDSEEILHRWKEAGKRGGSFRFSVNKEGVLKDLKDEAGWTATPVFARKFGNADVSYPAVLFDALPEAKIKRTVIPHPGESPPDVSEITWPLNHDLEMIAGIPPEEVYPLIPVEEIRIDPAESRGRVYVAGPEPGPYLIEELTGNGGPRRFVIKTWQKRKGEPGEERELLFFFPLSPHEDVFYPLAAQHSSLVDWQLSRLEPGSEKRRNFERQLKLDTGRTRIVAGADARGAVLYVTPTQSLLEYFDLIEPPPERQKVELVSGIVADPEIRRVEQLVAPLSDTPLTVTIKEKTGYPPAESWIPLADKASGEPSSYRLRLPVADPSTLNGGRVAVADEDRIIEYQLQRRKRGGFDLLLDGEKAGRLDVTGETLMLEIGTHFKIQGRLPKVTTVDSVVASGPVGKAALDILLAPLRGEVPIPIVYQEQEVDRTKPPEEDDWSWHDPVTREVSFERKGDFALSGAVDSKGAEVQLDRLTLEWRGQVFTLLRPPVADFGGQAFNKSEFPAWFWGEVDEASGEWVDYDSHVISLERVKVREGEIPILRDFTVTLTRKGIKEATWIEHRIYPAEDGGTISVSLCLQPEGNSPQPPLKLRGGDGGVMSSRIKIEKASWRHIVLGGLLKTDKDTVAWGDTVDLVWEDYKGCLERRHYRLTINENPGVADISENQTKTQSLPLKEEGGNIRVMWEEEGDKIRLYAIDHFSTKGNCLMLNRSKLLPRDFSIELPVFLDGILFGPVKSWVTVTHGPDGFQVQSNLKTGSDEKGVRWIGHETEDGFVIQHLVGRGGKVADIRLKEGKPHDIRIEMGGTPEEYRLVLKGGKIIVTPIGLAGAPEGYETLDERIVGEWTPKESHLASLPSVSSVERFEQMADLASAVGNLDPNAFFVPDSASLREMMRIAGGGDELPDEQRTAKLKFISVGSGLRFEAGFIYDAGSSSWRVSRSNGEVDGLFRWNDSPFDVVTRIHSAPNGEAELLPIPPGTTRLRSVTVPGKAGIPVFVNATGSDGRELQGRGEAAIRGFLDYLAIIGTGIPEEEENRFSVVRRWEAGDDGMTATVTLGSASDGRTLSFTTVHDSDDGSFYFNGGRTELTVTNPSGKIEVSGLFQGFYHPPTDSYLFLEATPSGSRSPIAFRAVFLPSADPIFIPIAEGGNALSPAGSREWFDTGLVEKHERRKSRRKGEGEPLDEEEVHSPAPAREVILPESIPSAHRDLSPYLVNERDWKNLVTVTEADLGKNYEKHRWFKDTITSWLSEMGGDFQLLRESIAEFRAAQAELRSKIPPNPPLLKGGKGGFDRIPPARLWLMNANGVRLQVELVPHIAKKGQRPSWVFHPQGTTNQKANLRLVGVDPKRPGRMIQFFIPAFYKRSGADQTLSIYDPSLMGTGGIQRLKLTAFDGKNWEQNLENDFLIALYDTNGAHAGESGEEISPLRQTAARKRIVAEQRLRHLHHLVSETEEEFVVVDRTNGEIERVIGGDNPQIVEQDGRKIALFTLLEFNKFGKGKYTGRLVQIQYKLPAVPPDPSASLEIPFPEKVIVRTRDDLTKRGVWEEAEYLVYKSASQWILLVHPTNPAKRFELGFETERGREGWPRIRSVRGFEEGLDRFYTPPHWNLVYPVKRVRAEGTMGIGRREEVTGEYEGRNLPDGHHVHRYHFSVHDGSLQKVTRLDVEIDAGEKIVGVHPDRWEVDGVALDPELIRAETADAQTIRRLSAKLPSEEFLAATPLPDGQVRIFLLHRARGLQEAVGNTHYLAIDLKPDPETGNFLGQKVAVTRATFRHEPRDPAQFFAPSRLLNNFSYTRRTGKDAVPHPYGFMMIEPQDIPPPLMGGGEGEGGVRFNFLFYDETAHSRRKVEVTLRQPGSGKKGGDGFFTEVEPGSLNVINYNDGTEIVSTADAQLTSERDGNLVRYVLRHPQIELHFALNADGTFPADLNGRNFVIREFSTPQKLAVAQAKRDEEKRKLGSIDTINQVYREFVSAHKKIWPGEAKETILRFEGHPVSHSGLGLAVKYLLPIYHDLSKYKEDEVPEMIGRLLERAILLYELNTGAVTPEQAVKILMPEDVKKAGGASKGRSKRAEAGEEEDDGWVPPGMDKPKKISGEAARVLGEYLVAVALASKETWMKREWESLTRALDNFLELQILVDDNRVRAYGGFAQVLHQPSGIAIESAVDILVAAKLPSFGRKLEFYHSLINQDARRLGVQTVQDWFARFGMTDPLAEVSRKKVRPLEKPADKPADEATDSDSKGPARERGVNYLDIPPGRSPDPAKASRSGGKVGKGKGTSEPKGPGSIKASAAGLSEMMLPKGFEVYSGIDARQEQADRIMVESGLVEYLDDGGAAVAVEASAEEALDETEEVDPDLLAEADSVGDSVVAPVSGICGGALVAGRPGFNNVIRLSRVIGR